MAEPTTNPRCSPASTPNTASALTTRSAMSNPGRLGPRWAVGPARCGRPPPGSAPRAAGQAARRLAAAGPRLGPPRTPARRTDRCRPGLPRAPRRAAGRGGVRRRHLPSRPHPSRRPRPDRGRRRRGGGRGVDGGPVPRARPRGRPADRDPASAANSRPKPVPAPQRRPTAAHPRRVREEELPRRVRRRRPGPPTASGRATPRRVPTAGSEPTRRTRARPTRRRRRTARVGACGPGPHAGREPRRPDRGGRRGRGRRHDGAGGGLDDGGRAGVAARPDADGGRGGQGARRRRVRPGGGTAADRAPRAAGDGPAGPGVGVGDGPSRGGGAAADDGADGDGRLSADPTCRTTTAAGVGWGATRSTGSSKPAGEPGWKRRLQARLERAGPFFSRLIVRPRAEEVCSPLVVQGRGPS